MAKLYLVRHAQASFGAEDYDKLSDLGLRQSAYIPQHFSVEASAGLVVYRGSMLRQKETADIAFPSVTSIENQGLNEFDHMNVLSVHQPAIHDKAKMTEIIMAQQDPRQFMEDEFRTAISKWMGEETISSYHETFRDFKSRIQDTMSDVMASARREKQKQVVVVTSGGVIGLYMTMLLDIPDLKMMALNQQIANTSVTSLLFNDKKKTLSYYNNFSHLPQEMVTFM